MSDRNTFDKIEDAPSASEDGTAIFILDGTKDVRIYVAQGGQWVPNPNRPTLPINSSTARSLMRR